MNPKSKMDVNFPVDLRTNEKRAWGDAVSPSSEQDQQRKIQSQEGNSSEVTNFPKHLYVPFGAQSVDIRNVEVLASGSQSDILVFECPIGMQAFFFAYGLFNDSQLFANSEFIPKVNGSRVFPFHGLPQAKYKMALGLAPDLGNNSMIDCQLLLNPKEKIIWTAYNNAGVDGVMGVRMKGYVTAGRMRIQGNFGG